MKMLLLNPPAKRPELKVRMAKHSKAALIKVLSFAVIVNLFPPIAVHSDFEAKTAAQGLEPVIPISSLVASYVSAPVKTPEEITAVITWYNSEEAQTDDSPYITASNTYVHRGVAAANWLLFGTEIKIPGIYGSESYFNEDRMNPRFNPEVSGERHIDIWVPTKAEAIARGVKKTKVLIF